MKEFEEILYGLRDGDKALGLKGVKPPKHKPSLAEPLTPEAAADVSQNPPYLTSGEAALSGEEALWVRMTHHINEYEQNIKPVFLQAMNAPNAEEARATLSTYNIPVYVAGLNQTVKLFSDLSDRKVYRFQIFLFACLGVIIAIIGTAHFLAWAFIERPIREVHRGMEAIVKGDLNQKIPVRSRDEIGDLAGGFNVMAAGLAAEIGERKQAEEVLQQNLGILRAVIEGTSDIIFVKDRQGRILMINTAGGRLFGKPVEEIVGKDSTELFPPDTARRIMDDDRRIMASGKTETYEEDATVKGITRTYLTTKGPYLDHRGNVIGIIGIAHDITERKRADELIKASLSEKEELLKEVHHRVKNNLQIISSLLDMSRMQTDNEEANRLLMDACSRVGTMALIHSQLYRSDRFDRIDMDRHLREMTNSLLQLYGQKKNIVIDIKAPDVYLPVSQAIPCALALNELISNALEHAYKDREKGTLEISMQRAADDTVSIRIKDDGAGIPEDVDVYKTNTLGLKLVRNLVEKQLKGKMYVKSDGGMEFVIEFKVSEENGEKV